MDSTTYVIATACLAIVLGCSDSSSEPSTIDNPSGNCSSSTSEARPGFSTTDPWLNDCRSPLAREYWRVYAVDEKSAYTLPRIDDAAYFHPVCKRDSADDPGLVALVDEYSLCDVSNPDTVAKINDMLPEHAFAFTRWLHAQLEFVYAPPNINQVVPHPLPGDIIDACELDPASRSADFVALCDRERGRLDSGSGIGFTYDGPAATELVARLDQLYEVGSCRRACENTTKLCGSSVQDCVAECDERRFGVSAYDPAVATMPCVEGWGSLLACCAKLESSSCTAAPMDDCMAACDGVAPGIAECR